VHAISWQRCSTKQKTQSKQVAFFNLSSTRMYRLTHNTTKERFVIMVMMCMLATVGFGQKKTDFLILAQKKIIVTGFTSIGSFHCHCILKNKDTLFLNDQKTHFYSVAVKAFNCGNFLLNRDFQKTLNEEKHPFVFIHLGEFKRKQNTYTYTLNVNIAGKQKTFANLTFSSNGKQLDSQIELNFSDFKLKPPNKLGNAIKVKDKITLRLHFEIDR